jgi:putative NADH-flavin reductase
MSTIAIFGASGQTGQQLTRQALKQGYAVKALVRNPAKLTTQNPNLKVIQGDLTDPAQVEETVRGTDAVLSVIGAAKGSPSDIKVIANRNIGAAMQKNGVKRYIRLSSAAFGEPEPGDAVSLGNKILGALAKTMMAAEVQDERQSAALTKESDLDWTLVRAMAPLNNQPAKGHYQAGRMGVEVKSSISRADVASFMLDELKHGKYVRQAPVVGN